jgi:hypothetical protein
VLGLGKCTKGPYGMPMPTCVCTSMLHQIAELHAYAVQTPIDDMIMMPNSGCSHYPTRALDAVRPLRSSVQACMLASMG